MEHKLHEYPVVANWTGGRDGAGDLTPAASGKTLAINVPPELGGPGGETNPEELMSCALAGCYSITAGIVLANRKLPVVSIRAEAVGTVEQKGANFAYRSFEIRPTITLAADATDEQVEQARVFAHKADNYCIMSNAIRATVEITVEPTVVRA